MWIVARPAERAQMGLAAPSMARAGEAVTAVPAIVKAAAAKAAARRMMIIKT
jgi:hypothetical protein